MHLDETRLVLRYNPGQFTFTRFDRTSSDAELFALARKINTFQEDEAQIVKIQRFAIW